MSQSYSRRPASTASQCSNTSQSSTSSHDSGHISDSMPSTQYTKNRKRHKKRRKNAKNCVKYRYDYHHYYNDYHHHQHKPKKPHFSAIASKNDVKNVNTTNIDHKIIPNHSNNIQINLKSNQISSNNIVTILDKSNINEIEHIHDNRNIDININNLNEYNLLLNNLQYKIYNPYGYKPIDNSHNSSEISSISSIKKKEHLTPTSVKIQNIINYIHNITDNIIKFILFVYKLFNKISSKINKFKKDFEESPKEKKEKLSFIFSTFISTILFYILFICLNYLFSNQLPYPINKYSFSISWIVSYLTSVMWQYFINQFFVFDVVVMNENDDRSVINGLIKTYIVYIFSLVVTAVMGTILQVRYGISDQIILLVTLPISGIMNYYLLKYSNKSENISHSKLKKKTSMMNLKYEFLNIQNMTNTNNNNINNIHNNINNMNNNVNNINGKRKRYHLNSNEMNDDNIIIV